MHIYLSQRFSFPTMDITHILSFGILLWLPHVCTGYGTRNKNKDDNHNIRDDENFEALYNKGRDAYLENNFRDCVKYLEGAVTDYNTYTRIVNGCKRECKKPVSNSVITTAIDLIPYEGLIQETLCLMKCKRGKIPLTRKEELEDGKILDIFLSKNPYDFLQLCYYQTQDHQSAANAAFTNLVYNPDHPAMKDNLKYYLALPDVDKDQVVNLEAPEYVRLYLKGKSEYGREEWEEMIGSMEAAVVAYMEEEENCRVECEKPFNMGWFPDFVSSVANHFTYCLKCKLNCATLLHNINGDEVDDLIPMFYHYLQFAYFKVDDVESAADCTVTYLQFFPESEDMLNNIQYYRAMGGEGRIRENILAYLEREKDELALLNYIQESFVFDVEEDSSTTIQQKKGENFELGRNDEEDKEKEFVAEWSEEEGRYVVDVGDVAAVAAAAAAAAAADDAEKELENFNIILQPPPIVKFEL